MISTYGCGLTVSESMRGIVSINRAYTISTTYIATPNSMCNQRYPHTDRTYGTEW